MSLHDRIIELQPIGAKSQVSKIHFNNAKIRAAEIVKEADELMAEMALTLQYLADEPFNSGTAAVMLRRYNNWKESTK